MYPHGIDFIDAVQLVTLLKGGYRSLGEESQSIFITADRAPTRARQRRRRFSLLQAACTCG